MSLSDHKVDRALTSIVTTLAALVALLLALALPAAFFLSAYETRHAEIAAEGKIAAEAISQLASNNPELWIFENVRIRGLLSLLGLPPVPERRIVMSQASQVVAEQGDPLPLPVMRVSSPIYDSGVIVGRVEIQRSLQSLFVHTAMVALLAGSLGVVAFLVLRSWPLRLLHRALARSTHLATHDTLTGLPNRALFRDRVDQSLAWARRDGASVVVLYLDLDRFKEVNDTLGHTAGDRLLIDVATRLQGCVRETDTLGRLGGDEFALVQVGVRQLGDIELLAQRLIGVLDQAFDLGGYLVNVGVSIGIAVYNPLDLKEAADDAGLLLQEADVALYRAKEEGRGTYRFFAAEMNQRLLERRTLEADILEALEQGQFSLCYQPQFDLAEDRIVGAEALLRWQHPVRGIVSPGGIYSTG